MRTYSVPSPVSKATPLRFALVAICLAICPFVAQSQSTPLPVAIVGLVHGHVEGFLSQLPHHPDVQLVGIVEPDPALALKYEKRFSLDHHLFYSKLDAMISQRHPRALLVYTSIADHRKVIEAAAQRGVSVMVEKPLTVSLDDALAIRRAARDGHIQVLVNYETTWYASNRAAYDELQLGKIGDVRKVVIHDGHSGPKEIGVPPEFLGWLTDPQQNGAGALYDFGCYGADLMTWLMKGEAPVSVTAVVQHDKPAIYPNVDDDATVILSYPHAQAVLQPSWNWPFSRKDMEVYGSTGYAITIDSTKMRIRHEHDEQETPQTAPPLTAPNDDSLHYLAAVMNGQLQPQGDLTALDTNIVVMQILDAARESARTGRTVRLLPLTK
jgi:glucose-fructose oxidoreductase